nr:hypothetical protein [Tanacetum cinerariifolium]
MNVVEMKVMWGWVWCSSESGGLLVAGALAGAAGKMGGEEMEASFSLENKIMSITLDNVSNNTSAIGKLKLKYEPPMDDRFYHSRCVAHIINLVVQDGLAVPAINEIKESFKTMSKDVFKSSARTHQRYIKICSDARKPCLSPNRDILIRWNSNYHMFLCGLKQISTLMYLHDLLASKGVYYPTSPLVLQQIFFTSNKLTDYELNGGIFPSMVKPMKQKLKKVTHRVDKYGFGVFDDSYATKAKKWFNDSLEGLCNIYYAKYGNPTTESSSGTSLFRASGRNQMSRLLNQLQEHTKKKARNDHSLSSEFERYVNSDFVTLLDNNAFATFDLLGFWKAKESMFPVLSRMAMDIISVQATSAASKSAYSTSGRVLSIQRTRLTSTSLEMYFKEEILDAEVQQNEAILLSEEEIALDVASSEGTMFGSGSGGEEVDYDMTNYGYDDYE